nr:BON domain-containing protein [Rhizobium paknamense]
MGSSRYPRMGREDWSSDDLGYGDGLRRSGSDRSQPRQRYDSEGYYPSDHPEYRGGYGRGEAGNGWHRDRGFMEKASDEVASWFGDREAERRRDLDQHRGKGPRGYKRTDARVLEDVNDRLSDDPAVDASDIDVQVADGEVTLSGEVSSRYEKRRAEDVAESVSGVHNVQNNIRVRRASPSDASSTTSFS